MGYEVKIYVGDKCDGLLKEGDASYLMVAGMIDLCKPGYDSKIYKLCSEGSADEKYPLLYYYRNGSDKEEEDCYGKKLRAVPLDLVIDALKIDVAYKYWRFDIALEFLESIKRHSQSDRLVAMLYGY